MKFCPKLPIARRAGVAATLGLLAFSPAGATHIRLRNGASLDAEVIKETSDAVFVDLGSEVAELKRADIASLGAASAMDDDTGDAQTSMTLSQISPSAPFSSLLPSSGQTPPAAQPASAAASASTDSDWAGIADAALKNRHAQTSSEVLQNAKRGVVLVSTPSGWGSGFVIDRRGHILTNQHVVLDEKYVDVTFIQEINGQSTRRKITSVEITALNPLMDMALLKIPDAQLAGLDLDPLPLAPERSLIDGNRVYAIGNPGMGMQVLDLTLSQGIVSSAARNFNDVLYVQTTAAVNPGNSGGPLLNGYGEVVGIVSLRAMFQEGIAFALPVEYIRHFLYNQKAFAYGKANPNTGYHYLSPE